MQSKPQRFSDIGDDDLERLLRVASPAAAVELVRRYGKFVGTIITRINRDWITREIVIDATDKVLELVKKDLCKEPRSSRPSLKVLIQNTSEKVAIMLWRDAHAENHST